MAQFDMDFISWDQLKGGRDDAIAQHGCMDLCWETKAADWDRVLVALLLPSQLQSAVLPILFSPGSYSPHLLPTPYADLPVLGGDPPAAGAWTQPFPSYGGGQAALKGRRCGLTVELWVLPES